MSEEQINTTIAEACGWKKPDHPNAMALKQGWVSSDRWWVNPHGELKFAHDIPNYCTDLNAMHEAEEVLNEDQVARYVTILCLEVQLTPQLYHATARQRAEAFLCTLGKWDQSGDSTEMVKEVQK
jgi:hypothetical protein